VAGEHHIVVAGRSPCEVSSGLEGLIGCSGKSNAMLEMQATRKASNGWRAKKLR
jgi:hypothetical protein